MKDMIKRIMLELFLLTGIVCIYVHACSAGEYITVNNTCSSCPKGTFRPESSHRFSFCIDCQPREKNVAIHYECNATHNTGCPLGRFETDSYPQVYQQCTVCSVYEAEPCTPMSDSICCDYDNMTLVEKANDTCMHKSTHGRYCCEFQSQATSTTVPRDTIASTPETLQDETSSSANSITNVTCSRNMYNHQATNSCKRCEPCTYIDQETHSQQSCDLCTSDKPKSCLVYCPKHCDTQNKGGLGNVVRVAISYLTAIFLPVAILNLYLLYKLISLCRVFHLNFFSKRH